MSIQSLDEVGLKKLIEDTNLGSPLSVVAFPDAIDRDFAIRYAVSYSCGKYANEDSNGVVAIPYLHVRMHRKNGAKMKMNEGNSIEKCFFSSISEAVFASFLEDENDIAALTSKMKLILNGLQVRGLLIFNFESVGIETNCWQNITELSEAALKLDLPIVLVVPRSYAKYLRTHKNTSKDSSEPLFYHCDFGDSKALYDARINEYVTTMGFNPCEVEQCFLDELFTYTRGHVSESFKILDLIERNSYQNDKPITRLDVACLDIYLNA